MLFTCKATQTSSNLYNNYKEIEKLKVALSRGLSTPRAHIIGSLIHMRCNRVFGVNRDKEKFVLSIFNEIEDKEILVW